jgi:hypothetical protein
MTDAEKIEWLTATNKALMESQERLAGEVKKKRKLAYFGDHYFPDLTWKVRCEELLEENKEMRKLLAEARVLCDYNVDAQGRRELRVRIDAALAEPVRDWQPHEDPRRTAYVVQVERERDEARAEVNELRKLLRYFFGNGGGIPYAQWTREQHAAYDLLQKGINNER